MTGNVIMTVAVPWLVLTTTGSAAVAGTVVFAGVASATVGGLAAGRVVDAIGAVRASAVADLLSGLAVAPLPVLLALDALEIWQVVLLTVLGTLADAAGSAARQSLVPVAADAGGYRRERANAQFTSAEHVGYLLGAPAAGLLIAGFGVGPALCVTVASFAFAALVVLGLADLSAGRDAAAAVTAAGLRETVAFIWGDPALRALVVFPTAAVLLVGPLAPLVLPVLARVVFDDPVVLGVMVAGYGAGGLLGAVGYGVLGRRVPRRALYLGIFVVWPCAYAAILLVPSLPVTLVMLVTLGAAAGSLVPLAGHDPAGALTRPPAAPRRRAQHGEHPGRRSHRCPGHRLPDRRARPGPGLPAADRRRGPCRRRGADQPVDAASRRGRTTSVPLMPDDRVVRTDTQARAPSTPADWSALPGIRRSGLLDRGGLRLDVPPGQRPRQQPADAGQRTGDGQGEGEPAPVGVRLDDVRGGDGDAG